MIQSLDEGHRRRDRVEEPSCVGRELYGSIQLTTQACGEIRVTPELALEARVGLCEPASLLEVSRMIVEAPVQERAHRPPHRGHDVMSRLAHADGLTFVRAHLRVAAGRIAGLEPIE